MDKQKDLPPGRACRIVAHTPLGRFVSTWHVSKTLKEHEEAVVSVTNLVQEAGLNYFSFENGDGHTVILKKDLIDNSVFTIETYKGF